MQGNLIQKLHSSFKPQTCFRTKCLWFQSNLLPSYIEHKRNAESFSYLSDITYGGGWGGVGGEKILALGKGKYPRVS